MNPVEAHYDRDPEREWERLARHRTEFAVTCRVLVEHLPSPPGHILDVGGGPGRYALHLSRLGYRVTLLDLSPRSLDLALERATAEGIYLPPPIRGDATALPADFTERFDAVLLLGPLYHLPTADERLAAVREAYRVLRPGGYVFAAFITRFAPLRDVAIHSPQWIVDNPERFRQLLEEGTNLADEASAFPNPYFARPEEIEPLMAAGGTGPADRFCRSVGLRLWGHPEPLHLAPAGGRSGANLVARRRRDRGAAPLRGFLSGNVTAVGFGCGRG